MAKKSLFCNIAIICVAETILAHGVYLEDAEIALLRERRSAIVHCPNSNFTIRSGICNVRRLIGNQPEAVSLHFLFVIGLLFFLRVFEMLANGVTVALGTDVSGC
jgi:cytosine/adenosine deaminase-related metal-dependent hydrolase